MNKPSSFLWDDCNSIEEQRARVFRQWLADPKGRHNERWDNERLVRLVIEYWVQTLFKRSEDQRLHEYWSDGIIHLECHSKTFTDLRFSGTSYFSDRFANREWFAPFELEISYAQELSNVPAALNLRFGEVDPTYPFARIPLGTHSERKAAGINVHANRPAKENKWAVSLTYDPYAG